MEDAEKNQYNLSQKIAKYKTATWYGKPHNGILADDMCTDVCIAMRIDTAQDMRAHISAHTSTHVSAHRSLVHVDLTHTSPDLSRGFVNQEQAYRQARTSKSFGPQRVMTLKELWPSAASCQGRAYRRARPLKSQDPHNRYYEVWPLKNYGPSRLRSPGAGLPPATTLEELWHFQSDPSWPLNSSGPQKSYGPLDLDLVLLAVFPRMPRCLRRFV